MHGLNEIYDILTHHNARLTHVRNELYGTLNRLRGTVAHHENSKDPNVPKEDRGLLGSITDVLQENADAINYIETHIQELEQLVDAPARPEACDSRLGPLARC